MKKIKKYTYYLVLFSIVLGACGRQDKADAEQLNQINEQVESLYNEEMNDLAEANLIKKFEEVEESMQAINEVDLNEENEKTLKQIEGLYDNAVDMYELEEDIQELFAAEIVVAEVEFEDLAHLSARLSEIDQVKWTNYVSRQAEKLVEAEKQLENIAVATKLVDQFYLDEDRVNHEANREEESTAKEAVAQVKNEAIREDLEKRLEKVSQTLTKVEEEYKKATEGVGFFKGMYLSEDNFILYIDEKQYFIAQNEASDNFFYYEVTEIIKNTGKELTLGLYEQPVPTFGIEGGNSEETFYISDDHDTISSELGSKFERLTQEEIDAILENLNGIKNTLERSKNQQ